MAKKQTFEDKVAKAKSAGQAHCPVCDDLFHAVKVRQFVNEGGKKKFVTKIVKVCKCNQSEVFG
jgi:hypothetical protein